MRIEAPTPKDMLSLELVISIPIKKSRTTSRHRLLIQKRMKSELFKMRLRVEVEKNFTQ